MSEHPNRSRNDFHEIPSPSQESRAAEASPGVDRCEGMAKPAAGDASDSQHGLYALRVDLTGSNAGPLFQSVRHLMSGAEHGPEALRHLCAGHYAIPLEQVGEAEPITQERWDEEEELWAEEAVPR